MDKWQTMTLREAGIILIDCDHRTPPATISGYPYVTIPQLKNGRIDLADVRYISNEHFKEWTKKANPEPYDVVLSRRCNPGETAFVPPGLKFALGQNLVLLRASGSKVIPEYLRWLAQGDAWWEQISKFINVGAVFDSLRCADIPNFKLPIPPIQEQHSIANLLQSLDNKIELNQRMNETLDGIAHALFKSWFVDFDPVKAKAEGRKPEGMDDTTAALLPSAFTESILGPIPEGWEISSLGEFIELAYGRALKANGRNEGYVPVYGSNGQIGWHDTALVKGPGIVVGRKGNPGTVIYVHEDFFPIDTTFFVIPSQRVPSIIFLSMLMERLGLPSLSADSAVPGLNRNAAYSAQCILPPSNLIENFNELITPFILKKENLRNENKRLIEIRDLLLPRLISGKLRIADGTL